MKIDIKEGKRAKIRQINIVGNDTFNEKDILESFELKTPNWLSWYKQNDRYSRESLQGDLEKLRSFYMDRGYANFQVESTQVAIAPEKDDIFITVNVNEGEVFKVSEVKLAGTFVVPEAELRRYLLVQPGETFSRKLITSTQELLQNRLGEDGYAFAKVDPVPTPRQRRSTECRSRSSSSRATASTCATSPSAASNRINDEVLRREMRQLEGGWLSNTALERSKQRIQRLPYVKKVESETTPVAGRAGPRRRGLQGGGGPERAARRRHRLLRVAELHPERQLRRRELHGHGQAHRPGAQLRPLQQGVQLLAHQPVHERRQPRAHDHR